MLGCSLTPSRTAKTCSFNKSKMFLEKAAIYNDIDDELKIDIANDLKQLSMDILLVHAEELSKL